MLRPGDHVVVPDDAYGGSYRLVARVAGPWGVEHTPVHLADLDAVRAAIRPGSTRVVWVETPTNPMLAIADITELAHIAHEAGALLVVDNTFATPYLQSPLALGADVVVHSTTKYAGGHSDVVGGALVGRARDAGPVEAGVGNVSGDVVERVGFHQNAMGAVPSPFDAFLVQRGLKTLAVRMEKHCDNAERVAEFLVGHPRVRQVLYPGLPEHPGHDVAQKQMRRFGGMVSFRVVGGEEDALNVCKRTEVFTLAESLGGIESLIEHPGRMTHASVAGSALEVPNDLIRLSASASRTPTTCSPTSTAPSPDAVACVPCRGPLNDHDSDTVGGALRRRRVDVHQGRARRRRARASCSPRRRTARRSRGVPRRRAGRRRAGRRPCGAGRGRGAGGRPGRARCWPAPARAAACGSRSSGTSGWSPPRPAAGSRCRPAAGSCTCTPAP